MSISDRSSTAHSFDSESGSIEQPQDGRVGITMEDYSVDSVTDQCQESIPQKAATLQKWQRRHKRCSCGVLVLSLIFMACSSFHILFPPKFDQMMKWHQKSPHERSASGEHHGNREHGQNDDGEHEHHGHGGRNLKHGGNKKDDEEFFVVKNNFEDDYWNPEMTFNNDKHQEGKGGRGHHNGDRNDGEGDYKVDKKILQERRISKLVTRASFVGFVMWFFVAIAACKGLQGAKMWSNSKWFMPGTICKSMCLLMIASVLGIWKLCLNHKLMN